MTRVFLSIALALTLAGAALAQDVIRIPLEVEPDDAQEQSEGELAPPPTGDRATGEEQDLSEEDLLELFMQPLEDSEGPIEERPEPIEEDFVAPIPEDADVARVATIRGLDKITARVTDIQAPVGVPVMFNSFEILVQTCDKRPPEETPEVTAFLQITEHRIDGTLARIFSGWMYASTPSLNPVEHSTYDVWVIDCRAL